MHYETLRIAHSLEDKTENKTDDITCILMLTNIQLMQNVRKWQLEFTWTCCASIMQVSFTLTSSCVRIDKDNLIFIDLAA